MSRTPTPPRSLMLIGLMLIGLVIISRFDLAAGFRPFAWLDTPPTIADLIILWLALTLCRTLAESIHQE